MSSYVTGAGNTLFYYSIISVMSYRQYELKTSIVRLTEEILVST